MKIVQDGYVTPLWPHSEQWKCPRCSCLFTTEESDAVKVTPIPDHKPGDASHQAEIVCPMQGCGATVTVYDWRSDFR